MELCIIPKLYVPHRNLLIFVGQAFQEINTALPIPFCPGLEVIFALPSSVSITEPFVIMFLLMKCLLAGLSVIVLILTCLNDFDFGSNKFAVSALSNLNFLLAPIVLMTCFLFLPSFVKEGS